MLQAPRLSESQMVNIMCGVPESQDIAAKISSK